MASIPKTYKRLMVQKLTTNFRAAVTIETMDMCRPQKGEVCVKIKFVGISADDVNVSKGRYYVDGKVPFGIGFEAVGEVVAVGDGVVNAKVGQSVAFLTSKTDAYAEYTCVVEEEICQIPKATSDYLVLIESGLTAAIGLDKAGRVMAGETVLITAAAGGVGHMAVQWAKAADCHVIGTCSTDEKEQALKDLGCDRAINYKKENIAEVLAKEYPNGVDVVWEVVSGKMLETCLKNLAMKGRLVVAGAVASYKDETGKSVHKLDLSTLPEQVFLKSQAVQGFLMLHYRECFDTYFRYLSNSLESGKLKILSDNGLKTTGSEFIGFEGIIRGVEHLYTGKNIGKVIARIY